MTTVLYVGGVNSTLTDELVGALKEHFAADVLLCSSVRHADQHPETFAEYVERSDIIVLHSAGILTLEGVELSGKVIHSFGPPLDMPEHILAWRTIVKTLTVFTGGTKNFGLAGLKDAWAHLVRSFGELVTHFPRAIRYLKISADFDSVQTLNRLSEAGSACYVCWTTEDGYYVDYAAVKSSELRREVSVVSGVPGQHDELVLRPDTFLANYLNKIVARV